MNQSQYSEEIIDLRQFYGCARKILWTLPICCLLLFLLISTSRNSGVPAPAPSTLHKVSYFDFRSETDALSFLGQNFPVYPTLSLIIAGLNNEKSQFRTDHSSDIISMDIRLLDGSNTTVRIETTSLKALNIQPLISSIKNDYAGALTYSMNQFLRASKTSFTTGTDSEGLQARRQYIASLQGDPQVSVMEMTMADTVDEPDEVVPLVKGSGIKSLVFPVIAGIGLWMVCVLVFTFLRRKISEDYDIYSVMGDVKVISFSDFFDQRDLNWGLGILASGDRKHLKLTITGLSPEVDCLPFVDFLTALVPASSTTVDIVSIETPWSAGGVSSQNDSNLIVVVSRNSSRREDLKLLRDYCGDFCDAVPLIVICP